jgi:hypothetical protein
VKFIPFTVLMQGDFSTTPSKPSFSVMGEENRLHAGEPPALHIASDAIA